MKDKTKTETVLCAPNKETGLTEEQVQQRIDAGLTNKVKKVIGKTYPEIFFRNFVNFYNIFLLIIAVLLIYGKRYSSLFFIVIYLVNLGVGLYQDIKAHRLLAKLQLITQPETTVIRNGSSYTIKVDEIVLDDLIVVKNGNQICADGIIVEGTLGLNESMLTGESQIVYKKEGDHIYSGSYVVSGTAKVLVNKVGKDSYVNKLSSNARKRKGVKSDIKKTLDWMFKIISGIVILIAALTFVVSWDKLQSDFQHTIGNISGSLISMIPAGLYLLSSVSLTVGVLTLAKKRTLVQDLYSIETLARSTMLCLDKTGTITDGTMKVKDLVILGSDNKGDVEMIIANHIAATKDENATSLALKETFTYKQTETPKYVSAFSSDNKYSFVTYSNATYVLGAFDFMDAIDKEEISPKIKEYSSKGYRVLTLAKAASLQYGKKVEGKVKVIALIILEDHIKDDAKETIAWFKKSGVKIRVISGDDAVTVSEIAKRVEIEGADKFISLSGLSDEEIERNAPYYTVFGRVTPEQKELLINTFKKNGEVVAMTGDGVNDILALKKADCSIAMANGSQAAQNVSQLVMLDSNFASLPSVVSEGRRVVNNLKRTCSLFLVKTIFAMVLSAVFLFSQLSGGQSFPFETNHLYLWEFTVIGMGAFFVSLEPNDEPIRGSFINNILKQAIPGAIAMLAIVLFVYILHFFQINGVMYTRVYDVKTIVTMCAIMFAVVSLANFYKVCSPLSKYRILVFIGAIVINIVGIMLMYLLEGKLPENLDLFKVAPSKLDQIHYVEMISISLTIIGLYLGIYKIIEILRGKKETNDDQNQ